MGDEGDSETEGGNALRWRGKKEMNKKRDRGWVLALAFCFELRDERTEGRGERRRVLEGRASLGVRGIQGQPFSALDAVEFHKCHSIVQKLHPDIMHNNHRRKLILKNKNILCT